MYVIFEQLTDQEILALLEPIISDMMDGSPERKHDTHRRDFTGRLLRLVTPENLSGIYEHCKEQWGYLRNVNLWSCLEGPILMLTSNANSVVLTEINESLKRCLYPEGSGSLPIMRKSLRAECRLPPAKGIGKRKPDRWQLMTLRR